MSFDKKSDEFYENQVMKIWDVNRIEGEFSEKFYLRDRKTGESKGVMEWFHIDEEYEIAIYRLKDKFNEKIINPEIFINFIEIMYCLEGECFFTSNFEDKKNTYYLKKGDILVHKANNSIKDYDVKGRDLKLISIDVYLDQIVSSNGKSNRLSEQWKEKISNIFKEDEFYFSIPNEEIKILAKMIESIEIFDVESYLNFKLKVFQFILSILELQFKTEPDEEMIVKNIKKILKDNSYSKFPTINELCKNMKISRYKLQSSFMKIEGIGINQYIKKKKMDYSKILLMTEKTILEIANEIGYENPSKFSEAFKSYFEILPREYRKNHKK